MDGGFLGPFDQYVSGPYLDWFNSNVEVPVLTFECGCNRAVVEEAVNQNAGLEKTLFDVGVVSGVVIASAAILTPYVLGTIAPTALGACEEDPEACEPPPTPRFLQVRHYLSTSRNTRKRCAPSGRAWTSILYR